ncbi:GNAT family N-acetyltransferase [Octadecabacter sp.]|nr:GNAT family N-acetyltransferase [Octadecabacter sp.]MDB4122692.1 GNAT family N-acetyltransferase [Octadecabacter sp.]MDC1229478.1 GNAT family N-acetyltransferase [Octadecabacter sp.]MDC1380809.1 GNAT family N-acetyltransferase [Octadecabacter sp.]
MLVPDHWRKGYVREAFEAIIPGLWKVTDHDALTGDIDPNNAASLVLSRLRSSLSTHLGSLSFEGQGAFAT